MYNSLVVLKEILPVFPCAAVHDPAGPTIQHAVDRFLEKEKRGDLRIFGNSYAAGLKKRESFWAPPTKSRVSMLIYKILRVTHRRSAATCCAVLQAHAAHTWRSSTQRRYTNCAECRRSSYGCAFWFNAISPSRTAFTTDWPQCLSIRTKYDFQLGQTSDGEVSGQSQRHLSWNIIFTPALH